MMISGGSDLKWDSAVEVNLTQIGGELVDISGFHRDKSEISDTCLHPDVLLILSAIKVHL